MPSGLGSVPQENFGSGMWRSVARHLIPGDGAYDLNNYLLDDDGNPYWRGGPSYLSTSAFGSGLLPILWDGQLVPGQRTVFANGSDYGVLDGSEGPVNLGHRSVAMPTRPWRPVALNGFLFVPNPTTPAGVMGYGGSRRTETSYSTGTVATTNGSKTLTGTGTAWLANVDPGLIFGITTFGTGPGWVVESVDSDTQITLARPYGGPTATGQTYALETWRIWGAGITSKMSNPLAVVAANRLWILNKDRAIFSATADPWQFAEDGDDYHELPDGAQILGGHELGDSLFVFATTGLHVISGIALDLTDASGNPQHTRRLVNENLILLSHEGIVPWAGALVVPCTDGIWLVDGASPPTEITQSITPLYRSYVAAGYKTGVGAVFRNHYVLPILDAANAVQDVLVCRLDRGRGGPRYAGAVTNTSQTWPWTHLSGVGARQNAFAVRTGSGTSVRNPKLLGASETSAARVMDATKWFGPDVPNKLEADGTAITKTLETKDYPTQDGKLKGLVKFLRLRYELQDAASDDPVVAASWANQDGSYTALSGNGAEDRYGLQVESWPVAKQPRFIRFKVTSSSPAARFVLRMVELLIRPSGKRR